MYLSMPKGEVSTTDIIRQALVQRKKVFVPYIHKSSESATSNPYMEMFALRSQEDLDNLQSDSWGIPTLEKASLDSRENALGGFGPSGNYDLKNNNVFEGLDLILLPGVAFDQSGQRLGHGKGFYDRFLKDYWELAARKNTNAKMPYLGMFSI